jgi:hypothetical protein
MVYIALAKIKKSKGTPFVFFRNFSGDRGLHLRNSVASADGERAKVVPSA